MEAPDRIQALLAQSLVTGLDFVYVHEDQVRLDVHFLRPPSDLDQPLHVDLLGSNVHIYSQSTPNQQTRIPVTDLDWSPDNNILQLTVAYPGDFSNYTLFIQDPDPDSPEDPTRIDPYFNGIGFSFKANCPSDLDCKPPEPECSPEEVVDFPINYQARDFWSFRQVLLDFASQRYPDWKDRLEADVGMMMAEVMSALGDEMAYYQDRVAREAYLQTATQRRSIQHHARLVDYHMHDGAGAFLWVDIQVRESEAGDPPISDSLEAGSVIVSSQGDSGLRIDFEIGHGMGRGLATYLGERPDTNSYAVDFRLNRIDPHCWDEDDLCLKVGTTEMFLDGHFEEIFPFSDETDERREGKWILLQTRPENAAQAERAHMVRVIDKHDMQDPVRGLPITRIRWEAEQALPFELDMSILQVHANMVPATTGRTNEAFFVVGEDPTEMDLPLSLQRKLSRAVERQGSGHFPLYLFSLPESEGNPLVWLGEDSQSLRPEVRLVEIDPITEAEEVDGDWRWRRSLLRDFASQQDRDYTLEPGTWRRVVGYQRIGTEIVHQDYASNAGHTVRFGDGEFGRVPDEGTIFKLIYRLGNGRRTNIAAESLTDFEDPTGIIASVNNPLPALLGLDPETPEQVRQLAPEAFRAETYRAVRPEDYAEAAERLPFVQRAGASFRWTGSWLSAFVTPDPLGATTLSEAQTLRLRRQLDQFRQAGREAHVLTPIYANLDVKIRICVQPSAYRGEVKARVMQALIGKKGVRPQRGFFSPDNFTFGTPLQRSALEAAIQRVAGVQAVQRISFRRRGWFPWRRFKSLSYQPGDNSIIRVEHDLRFPERGTIQLIMTGGA